jgi:hypothetical protein
MYLFPKSYRSGHKSITFKENTRKYLYSILHRKKIGAGRGLPIAKKIIEEYEARSFLRVTLGRNGRHYLCAIISKIMSK